jgi:uncharacterized repeat protein (TIGR03803 family)
MFWIVFVFCVLCVAAAIVSPAQTFTTLVSFAGANGANPVAPLIQSTDGNLYGTTENGGANSSQVNIDCVGCGTIFKVTPTGTLTTLYNFCSQPYCADGGLPSAPLLQAADGNFYGTTSDWSSCCGTVFKFTTSGVFTTLHSFYMDTGVQPSAGLVQASDGTLYGTTMGRSDVWQRHRLQNHPDGHVYDALPVLLSTQLLRRHIS